MVALQAEEKKEEKNKRFKYTSSTSFSFLLTRGNNNNQTFSFDTDQNFFFNKSRLKARLSVIYAQKLGEERSEIYNAQFEYNHQIKKGTYILALLAGERNRLAGNEFRFAYSIGAGFIVLKTEKLEVTSEISGGRTSENLRKISQLKYFSSYLSLIGTTRLIYTISKTSQLIHQNNFFFNFKEMKDWRVDSNTSLSASISKNFALKTSFRIIYDNLPVEGFKAADYYFLTSVVIKF